MKKYPFLLFLFISYSITSFAQRPAQGPLSKQVFNPLKNGYQLVWEDEFLGNQLDNTKWAEAVKVEDGVLKLSALKRGDSILISAVGTQGLFMPKYGFYECRAQLQQSPGVWGAFWLQSPKLSEGDDPRVNGAEIDIMEFFKKLGLDIVSHNVHWGPYGSGQHTTH
ncbi:MAG: glycosyl hydrolase family protein, partial [Chitinophagia bacterium]|nr:glycosyl hydrolase family protein [Chitinophagia bacterium]